MSKQDDGLFLLEVLIDKIIFNKSPCFSDKDFRTCVNIKCPGVEPLEICDDDPGACVAKSGGPFVKSFNNGKSCLFSLSDCDISSAMSKFDIKVSVYKSLPCGCLPTKIVMGETTINMTKEFVQARKKFLADPSNVSYQALKDSFRIFGPGEAETGEIVMFLRISCFGKMIITRFQGGGGPPNIGAGSRGSGIVDRSCNPRKDFQTTEDPCACGAARTVSGGGSGGGGKPCLEAGVCPPARDPYNSLPCEDPDDPCYCSGPKPKPKQNMACRNTDPYCLHIPKGTPCSLPIYQEMTKSQMLNIKYANKGIEKHLFKECLDKTITCNRRKQIIQTIFIPDKNIRSISDIPTSESNSIFDNVYSSTSSNTHIENKRKLTEFALDGTSNIDIFSLNSLNPGCNSKCTFANQKTAVYMTFYTNYDCKQSSGTQATASINECLQVYPANNLEIQSSMTTISTMSENGSTCTVPVSNDHKRYITENFRNFDVYFWGKQNNDSNNNPKKSGMGKSESSTKVQQTAKRSAATDKSSKSSTSAKSQSSSTTQTCKSKGTTTTSTTGKADPNKNNKQGQRNTGKDTTKSQSTAVARNGKREGTSASTCTGKSVSIKDEKCVRPCPASAGTNEDLVATVTHIRIGPKEPCPVYGQEPCQGPKCKDAASSKEGQEPVKVTTVNNPRRGVFELVVRRLTGAPLAKNELMLEWTPPPPRPASCAAPCPIPCTMPGPSKPSKFKMIVCRPVPCKPKCCKRGCKKPCGPMPCRSIPCKNCCKSSCCGKPCRPCAPCPPLPKCKPSQPCAPPCCKSPCSWPCKSSPCLRPCPVGRRKSRRVRSQPRIKAHRKRISPCCNRSKVCPVVQCRSFPRPCIACCVTPECPWPPRISCSATRCKPPKLCKSNCSTCC